VRTLIFFHFFPLYSTSIIVVVFGVLFFLLLVVVMVRTLIATMPGSAAVESSGIRELISTVVGDQKIDDPTGRA
jgi:glucose dehydrogenase